MSGFQITSTVRTSHRHCLWQSGWLTSKPRPPGSGKPISDINSLEPLMPDRAGVKTPWLDVVKLFLKTIPNIPRLIACRPSVVDARVHEAGDRLAVGTLVLSVNFFFKF